MEGQRAFAVRYMNGDVDWIPSSEAAGPDILSQHTLVCPPPMLPQSFEVFLQASGELAKSAQHPLQRAIQQRGVRALWVVEQQHAAAMQGNCSWVAGAPCVWCGQLSEWICDGVPPSRWSKGWFCEFHICSLCKVLYERCSFCCRWTGLPACATAEATELCGRSQVVLGDLAREYDETWRVPIERLPLHLQREFGSFCGGENRHGDSATQPLSCWFKIMVRRALCEDPPGEQRLPPRLPTPPASDSEEELEDFVYVPCGNLIFEATNP